jgi:adenylate cyclase
MDTPLSVYLPEDRRHALARGSDLPTQAEGSALFADIAGFTHLTEVLVAAYGARRGGELLTECLNRVYDALIAEVERFRGSVACFTGDAVTCWFEETFDGPSAPWRAVTCALAMQSAMQQVAAITIGNATALLALKVMVASGPGRHFRVGDPQIQLLDVLAGAPVERTGIADHLAKQGEVLADDDTVAAIGRQVRVQSWRRDEQSGLRFAVIASLSPPAPPTPWPALATPLPLDLLRPWVLPTLAERHLAGLGILLTELRPCVTCFVRFGGIDYDGDPDAGERLDAFIRRAQATLGRYEGTLLQIAIGEKGSYFYAVFGAPAAHEDDPLRAIHATLELQRDAAELELPPLQTGISQGTLRAGDYGARSRRAYGVLGDEVNLAARLMMLARPGEILVSGRVQKAIAEVFALDPHSPIPVKGKAEPLPVFAVAGRRRRRAIRLEEPDYQLPMVGRDASLARIVALLDQAQAGSGQVVSVVGDAGMGKSRLVAEVVRLARQLGFAGYGGSCQAAGARSPYMVWESIWRAFFDVDPDAPPRRQLRQLERAVEDLAPERADALPLLGPLLGIALAENDLTRELEPQLRRALLHTLLLDCLRAAADEARADGSGLLLVLEDLHWIDSASEDLLLEIARQIVDLPVLLVLAYRPPELLGMAAPRVEALPHCTRIELGPIDAADAEQVIRAKLAQLFTERSVGAPPALVTRVTALAQGNPFYVEELLSYLRDRGIDPRDSTALAALELPTSLHTLVLSRLDQLSTHQQATLKAASVIGRRFMVAWLQGAFPLLRETGPLNADLGELARLELTAVDTPEPELAYLFKHIVTREVAYESVSSATRAILHEQLGAYLEAAAGPDDTRYVDLLAYHYELSDNLPKKRLYLTRAAEAAAARFASAEALGYFERALALAPPEDMHERFALLQSRERLLDVLSSREPQRRDLDAMEQIAATLDDDRLRALVAVRRAMMVERNADYVAAGTYAAQAIELALAAGETAIAAEAFQHWTWSLLHLGEYDAAQEKAERALELALAAGDLRSERAAHNSLGGVAEYRSEFAVARRHYTRVLELSRLLGDKRFESSVLNNLGNIARHLGELAEARSCLEQSVAGFRLVGDRRHEGVACTDLGQVAADELNVQEAYRHYEQALAIAQTVGDREGEAWVRCALGDVARNWGDYNTARGYYEQALELFQAISMHGAEVPVRIGIGACAERSGNYAEALTFAESGRVLAEKLADKGSEAYACLIAANALAGLQRYDEATQYYESGIQLRTSLGWHDKLCDMWGGLARVALARGDLAAALAYTETILAAIQTGITTDSGSQPTRLELTLYDVLSAAGDPRAAEVLAAAYARLRARTAHIEDEQLRQAFLDGTPHRRRLCTLWEAQAPARALGSREAEPQPTE